MAINLDHQQNRITPSTGRIIVNANGSLGVPVGNTAQRTSGGAAVTGLIRFNTQENQFEGYNGTAWGALGGGSSSITFADNAPTGLGASDSGTLWYDSGTTGELFVWTGTEFISTLGDSQATFVRKTFVADGNTNTFDTGGNSASAPPFVYLNGILLQPTTDYSYASGVVTFVNTPPNLSVIEVVETGDALFVGLESLGIANHNLITVASNGNTTISGTLGVTGETTMGSAVVSDLTEDRVVLAGVNGALEDSANLIFGIVGATATVAGTQASPTVNSGDQLTINSTTVTLTGTSTVTGSQTNPTVTANDQLSINTVQVTLTGTAVVTGTTATPTVTVADEFSINGTTITLTGTDLASVISDITTAAISGITAANDGSDQLQITGTNVNVVLADVTNTPLADLGLTAGTTTATGNLTSVISDITSASIPNVTATNVANQLVLTGANVSIVIANVTNTPLTDLGITAGTTSATGNLTSVISDITTASPTSIVASDNGSSQLQLVGTDVDITLADVTNTPLASLGLTAGTTTRTGGTDTLTVTGNTAISGDITIGGNIILGDADTDSITVTADFASHLIPDADVTYDLGASGKAWRDLYVGGTSIYLGTLILKDDGSGNLLAVNSSNQPVNITGAVLAGTQLDIDNVRIDGNAITSTDTDGNITITPDGVGEVVVSTLTVSDLTDNRIPVTGTSGAVGDDANFTFDGTTLTVGLTTIEQATGNTTVGGTLDVTGVTNLNDTTGSTSATTGALIVDGGAGIAENLYVGTNLNVIGNTTLGDTNGDTLTVTAKVASDLLPNTAATHNLGSSSDTWNNLYMGGNITAPNLFTIDPITVSSSTTNYTVTVASGTLYGGGTGNVFYLENTTAGTASTSNPALTLYRGNTYVFDVSDTSNNNHPLRFTADGGTTEYTSGVTTSGTEGQGTPATVTFVVPTDAPGELNYYCTVHGTGMGNEIITRNLAGTVIIAGDLQVDGSQTTINSTTLDVDDLNITIAKGAANASAANGAGLTVDGANATLTYLSASDTWDFNKEPTYNGTSLLSSSSGVFKTFTVTDTDVIYSYTVTGSITAANSTDTVTFVSGSGIDIDIDTTQKAIRIEHVDTSTVSNVSTGNVGNTFLQELDATFDTFGHVTGFTATMGAVNIQDNYGIVEVSDTDSGYTWAATGTVTAAQEADTLKLISGDAIDIDADAASYAIRVTHGDTSSISNQTAATNTFLTAQTYDTYGHVQTNTFSGIDFNVAGNYAFGEIAVSGQTTVTPNTNVQTLTLVNGTGITITTDNTAKEITVTNSDRGSSQDIIKSIIAVDVDTGLSFSATGTYTASGNTDSFTFYGGTAIDVDIDTTNGALRIEHDVTGANTTIASTANTFVDAITVDAQGHVTAVAATAVDFNIADNYAFKTVVAGGTNLVAESNTDTLTISAAQTSSTDGIVITGDAATDSLTVAHADTSSVTDLTGTGNTFITGQTYDTMGHVLTRTTGAVDFNIADNYAFKTVQVGIGTSVDLVADSNTDTLIIAAAQTDSTDGIVITGTALTDTLTIAHADTSSITNLSVTANTFVDEVTFDTFGHVTALGTGTIDFNTADNYAFKTITDGTTNAVADSNTDTFKLRAGDQIEVTVSSDDATHGDSVLFGHADSGVSAGSKGSATEIPVVTVDAQGHVTALSTATPLIFKTFAVNGTNLVADGPADTLTITQGSGITLTGTAGTDTMDIAHEDTSSVTNLSVNNSGNTFVQDYAITFDTFGHVQTVSQTSVSVDFNIADNYAFKTFTDGVNNAVADSNTDTFTFAQTDQIEVTVDSSTDKLTIGHADSGVTANSYGGSGNLVSVTVDAQGHVTALSNVALNTDFTITDDASNTQTVSLGNTVTFSDSDGMSVVVGATDTVTFTNTDRGSQQNIVKSFEVIDSDPGGTSFAETGTISASSNTDTIKLLGGTNIDLDIDTTNKIIRVDSSGSAGDVFKTITVTDTNTGYTWSETGNVVASGTTDTLTLVSGSGIDLDVDASNQAILVQLAGAGNAFTVYNFTGNGSNQTFNTGSTNIVDVQVYVNGVLVKGGGTDYTFTNATGVLSFTVAPLNGDEIVVFGYQSSSDPVTLQQLQINNHNLVTVDGSGNVTISGNLTVAGSQSSGSSQTLSDPIITLGGANPPTSDDNKDRGVVFRWHDGTANTTAGSFAVGVEYEIITTGTTDFTLIGAADSNPGTVFTATGAGSGTGTALATSAQKLGFFGFDDTDQFFQFIPDATDTANVYTGTLGDAKFGGVKSGNIQIGVTGDNEIDTTSGNLTIDSQGGTTTIDDNASVSGTFEVTGGNSTFTGHLLPSADVTYDLGGATTQRWRDLYLSGTSIELGGATITASGSSVVLPAGSTIAGAGTIFDSTTSDTDDLSEGSTNLYYTDTRVQTYIGGGTATNISISGNLTVDGNTTLGDADTDTIAMTARISGTNALRFDGSSAGGSSTVFAITNPTVNRTITFKDATGTVAFTSDIPTDNSSLNNGANYITLTDLSSTNASASGGGSLSYNNTNGTFTFTPPDLSAKIELTDLSVTTAAAGTAGLSYNNVNGTFTFTPPDLSSYLTSESDTLDAVTGRGSSTTNGITVGTLNTHSIPAGTGTLALTSDIPTNNNQISNGANYITLSSISVGANASASGSGGIAYNNSNGVFTYTPPDLSSYLTSYTETDTLDSVTGRGATTANGITVGSLNSHTIPGGTGTLALTSDLSSFITLTNLSVTTAANSGSGSLSYNNSNGTFTFTPPDLSSYLTSESDTLDSVTGRGATTTNDITVGVLRAKDSATAGTVRFGDGTTHSIARSTNDLTIAQTVDAGSLILNSAGDVTINIDQDNDNTGKKFQILTNGSTDLVTVKDDGTVGIGTDNPGGKLTSYTSATRFQSLQGGSADLEIVSDNNTNPVALIKGTGTADLLNVFDNTTEVFTIVDGGSVGIGTTNPTAQGSNTKLSIQNGWTRTGNITHLHGDGSKSTTSTTVISGLLKASYRTLKYMISLTRGSEYQASEVLIVHNDTDAWATVYGTIYTGTSPLASFDAAISGSNVQLLATMTSATTTSYKFQVMAIDA